MIAMAQEETNKLHLANQSNNNNNPDNDNNSPKFTMATTSPLNNKDTTRIYRNDSGASSSLDYSLDSSMMGGGIGGSSTMTSGFSRQYTEEEYSQTSESAAAAAAGVVPSDEELFAIGWAKAFDPKSGSYYYFTLDRSKIVWDNPLEDTHTETSSSIRA